MDDPKTFPALKRMIRATLDEGDNPADLRVDGIGYACHHRSGVKLEAKERKVTCGKCGANLDPFEALLKISRSPDGYRRGLEEARKAALQAKKNLGELERMEKNAKGRAWRALSKMPAAEVVIAFAVECETQRLGEADRALLGQRLKEALTELAGAAQVIE